MAERLTKIIFDTSIYIPFINEGHDLPSSILEFAEQTLYLSAVVVAELYAGALDAGSIKLLNRVYETFRSLNRLITPSESEWQKAGLVSAKLGRKYGFENRYLSSLSNDILISLSARRIGAILVTENQKDFLRIKEFVGFKLYPAVSNK